MGGLRIVGSEISNIIGLRNWVYDFFNHKPNSIIF